MSVTPTVAVTSGEKAAWVQAWSGVATFAATVAGLIFVMLQIDFAKEQYLAYKAERNTERMEQFYREFTSPTMLSYRAHAAANHPQDSAYLIEVFSFFERLALAKKKGIVTTEDVNDYFGQAMFVYWCGFEEFVRRNRTHAGEDPSTSTLWGEFENAVKELRVINQQPRCATQAEIAQFMLIEKMRFADLSASHKLPETEKPTEAQTSTSKQ